MRRLLNELSMIHLNFCARSRAQSPPTAGLSNFSTGLSGPGSGWITCWTLITILQASAFGTKPASVPPI